MKHRLFWPVAALVSLIVINTVARSQFASITVQDGRLYGALIDILRQSAPLMLVSLGMTIVIATRGIDLSVGAVMAVSGAVALTIIDGSADPSDPGVVALAVVVAILVSLLLGVWNGFLVSLLGIQPIIATLVLMLAGRGMALLITEGFITTVNSTPFEFLSTGYLLLLPFAFFIWVAAVAVVALIERRTALGVLTEAVGINPEASRLAGVRSTGIIWSAYAASAVLAGIAGIIYASNIKAADANAAGQFIELYAILAVVLGGTSLMGGKFSSRGHSRRRVDHPDARVHDALPRGAAGGEPGVLCRRRRGRGGHPIAAPSPLRARRRPFGAVAQGGRTQRGCGSGGMTSVESPARRLESRLGFTRLS